MRRKYAHIGIPLLTVFFVLATTLAITQIVRAKNNPEKKYEMRSAQEDKEVPTNDDPLREITNLVNANDQASGVLYKGVMKLIDGNTEEDKILEEQNFEYTMFGNEYAYRLGSVEMVAKKSFILFANHDDRTISLLPINEKPKTKGVFDIEEFKKIVASHQANVAITQLGNQKVLTIDSIQNQEIQGYKIYYSPDTYNISKILVGIHRLFSLEDTDEDEEETSKEVAEERASEEEEDEEEGFYYYLEINYTTIKNLSLQESEFAPENKFINRSNGVMELKEAYKGYEFVNRVDRKK